VTTGPFPNTNDLVAGCFRRLLNMRGEEDCSIAFRRLVALLGEKVNIADLAETLLDWNDVEKGDRCLGGIERLRVSSQALKRAVRTSDVFQNALPGHLGARTQRFSEDIEQHLLDAGAKLLAFCAR
jgi:CT1975-like protein